MIGIFESWALLLAHTRDQWWESRYTSDPADRQYYIDRFYHLYKTYCTAIRSKLYEWFAEDPTYHAWYKRRLGEVIAQLDAYERRNRWEWEARP